MQIMLNNVVVVGLIDNNALDSILNLHLVYRIETSSIDDSTLFTSRNRMGRALYRQVENLASYCVQ